MNKRGIELSINFLVVVILSIVILGLGIVFVTQIFGQANDIKDMSANDLDESINDLMCLGSEKVCFGFDTLTIKRGNFGVLGVRVTNVMGEDKTFHVVVKKGIAFDKDGNEITSATLKDKVTCYPACAVGRKEIIQYPEDKNIALGFDVAKDARAGRYTFDIAVCTSSTESDKMQLQNDVKCAGSTTGQGLYGFNKVYIDVP